MKIVFENIFFEIEMNIDEYSIQQLSEKTHQKIENAITKHIVIALTNKISLEDVEQFRIDLEQILFDFDQTAEISMHLKTEDEWQVH